MSKTTKRRNALLIPPNAPILACRLPDSPLAVQILSAEGKLIRLEIVWKDGSPTLVTRTDDGPNRPIFEGAPLEVIDAYHDLVAQLEGRASAPKKDGWHKRALPSIMTGVVTSIATAGLILSFLFCAQSSGMGVGDIAFHKASQVSASNSGVREPPPPPIVPASALPAPPPDADACPLIGDGLSGSSTSERGALVKQQLAAASGAAPVVALPPVIAGGANGATPAGTSTQNVPATSPSSSAVTVQGTPQAELDAQAVADNPAAAAAALQRLQDAKSVIANGGKLSPATVAKLPHDLARSLREAGLVDETARSITRLSPAIVDQYRDRNGIASIPEVDTWTAVGGNVVLPLPGGGNIASAEDIEGFGLEP